MTKLIVLCVNEIPIGIYTTYANAMTAKIEHQIKEGKLWSYQVHEFVVDAAAKR
jgi:hypothetical protein